MNRLHFLTSLEVGLLLGGCTSDRPREESVEPTSWVEDIVFPAPTTILMKIATTGVVSELRGSEDEGASWTVLGQHELTELAVGADGSIWGTINDTDLLGTVVGWAIAISSDGGRSFTRLDLEDDVILFGKFIEWPDDDPLYLSDGQLFQMVLAPERGAVALHPFGAPMGRELIDQAAVCDGTIYAATRPAYTTHGARVYVWRDSAQTWEQQYELAGSNDIAGFACGAAGDPWFLDDDGLVFRYDPNREAWDRIVDVEEALIIPVGVAAFATHGDALFVASYYYSSNPVVRVSPSGEVNFVSEYRLIDSKTRKRTAYSQLPEFELDILTNDPEGRLWGAGYRGLFRWDDEAELWLQIWPSEEAP